MAINPAVSQYFTRAFWQNPAVVDVDINRANPNDNSTVGKALGVWILGNTAASGGSAATIADGADVAEGATSATAYSDTTGVAAGTVVGLLKGWYKLLANMFRFTGYGSLNVSTDATTSFSDPFDGGVVDVTNTWTTQLSTGTVTQANGKLTISSSTTASAYAAIFSKNSFPPSSIAPQLVGFSVQLESPILANMRRFWGMGTVPATPTTAIPITDGFGFELTETGVFRAVIYASSAVIASVNLTAPADVNQQGYGIFFRADSILFYVGNFSVPVAVIPFVAPNQTVLPIALVSVNGATPPAAGQSFVLSSIALGDYGKNTNQISDGLFPWRKATVKGASTAAVSADLPLVVALHPSSVLSPAGTGATSLGKAEDAVAASGDTGVFQLGVRRDTLTISASANGDYNEVAVDQYGSMQVRSYEKQARTYSASANITLAAAATDIATMTGNGAVSAYITKITISGIQTTGGEAEISLIKRSTANTAGTSTAMTAVPHSATDTAAVVSLLAYTANPTTGTTLGAIRRAYVPVGSATGSGSPMVFDFGDKGRPIRLNSSTEVLAINLNGATLTGGVLDVSFEWFEI